MQYEIPGFGFQGDFFLVQFLRKIKKKEKWAWLSWPQYVGVTMFFNFSFITSANLELLLKSSRDFWAFLTALLFASMIAYSGDENKKKEIHQVLDGVFSSSGWLHRKIVKENPIIKAV